MESRICLWRRQEKGVGDGKAFFGIGLCGFGSDGEAHKWVFARERK